MKKSIGVAAATLACLTGFGQGTVNFANIATGLNAPVFHFDGMTRLSGAQYRAGLFAGPDPANLSLIATTTFLTGGGAGYFNGGVVVIPNVPGGSNASIRVVAWDASFGTFLEAQAAGAFWGWSSVFSIVTGNPGGSPPTSPAALVGMNSFSLGSFDFYFAGFTVQPTNQTVLLGGTTTFHVAASASPQPFYQWYFNGEIIPGATSSSYQITNTQPAHAGSYSVVLSNQAWGVYVSDTATLTVLLSPNIVSPPLTQTAYAGSSASFQVSVVGPSPFAYQWLFNGSPIPGALGEHLLLTDLQFSASGAYAVAVTNASGSVTSAPALLNVIQPVPQTSVPALTLMGQPGSVMNLQAADALGPSPSWATFDSVTLTNVSQLYLEASSPLPPTRFYRSRQSNVASPPATLALHLAPALILTGPIENVVRIDYINQFGPTNAWVALDTLTLTNTPQLYIDRSAIGKPPRLWRIVPGQGTVAFLNASPAHGLDAPVFHSDGVTKLSGAQYRAGLFGGPNQTNLAMNATTSFLDGGNAGYFSGGAVTITNVLGGGVAWIQIVAWDTTLGGTTTGATFSQAQASGLQYWGASSIFSVVIGNPLGSPPTTPAAMTGLTSFSLGP